MNARENNQYKRLLRRILKIAEDKRNVRDRKVDYSVIPRGM